MPPPRLNSLRTTSAGRRKALPALCTTARLAVDSPPMNIEIPTTPSLPTTAISAEAPFSSRYSSETMQVVGRYTYGRSRPDSYTTSPRPSATGCRCSLMRFSSADDKAASSRLSLGSGVVTDFLAGTIPHCALSHPLCAVASRPARQAPVFSSDRNSIKAPDMNPSTSEVTRERLFNEFNTVIAETEQLLKSVASAGGEKAG